MTRKFFTIAVVMFFIGCRPTSQPANPIERAVKDISSQQAPQGMVYLITPAPTSASPVEVASTVLSQRYCRGERTNVIILESHQVNISHKDSKEIVEQWTAVLADTTVGKKILFLQRHQRPQDPRAS